MKVEPVAFSDKGYVADPFFTSKESHSVVNCELADASKLTSDVSLLVAQSLQAPGERAAPPVPDGGRAISIPTHTCLNR